MNKGIIYSAYNKISKKYYIGQTRNKLEKRVQGHYSLSKQKKYSHIHFMKALAFYDKNEWEWDIIEEINVNQLNEREVYWIKHYNSFEDGYNGNYGGNYSTRVAKEYSFYHPDYGIVTGNRDYFKKNYQFHNNTASLLGNNKKKQYKGWVLPKHKNNYDEYLSSNRVQLHSIYHPKMGTIKGTLKQLNKFTGIGKGSLRQLVSGNINISGGFVLLKNKKIYNKLAHIIKLAGEDGSIIVGNYTKLAKIYNKSRESFRQISEGIIKKIKLNEQWYVLIKD